MNKCEMNWKVLMNEWIRNKRGLNEWRMREE